MNIWISTDLHLYTKDNDERHPFRTRRNLGLLSDNFASDISQEDIWIFLGDLCDPIVADRDHVRGIIQSIPCTKLMCRGNHDTENDLYYKELGFDVVTDIIRLYNILFSHKPLRVAPDEVNIHGHLHTEMMSGLGPNHINAYAANWNDGDHPVLLEDLINSATVQRIEISQKEESHLQEKFEKYTSLDNDHYEPPYDISDMVNADTIDESALISEKDLVLNLELWKKNSDHNVLYITGMSGSGKSTLAMAMEREYNAYLVELDGVEFCFDSSAAKLISKVANTYPPYKKIFDEVQKTQVHHSWTNDEIPIIYEMCRRVVDAAEADRKNLYIIEGLQLYEGWDPDFFATRPIIIKGTSLIQSRLRALKRDQPPFITWVKQFDANIGDNRYLDQFKRKLKNINESVDPNADTDRDSLDEIIFPDTESTKFWMSDDDAYQKKVDKAKEQQEDTKVAIDESTASPIITVISEVRQNPNDKESPNGVKLTFRDRDGNNIGEASISATDTPNGFLYDLEVFPAYRGKGYANSIMNYVLSTYSITELTVEETNKIAISLYTKFGFKKGVRFKENGVKMIDMTRPSLEQLRSKSALPEPKPTQDGWIGTRGVWNSKRVIKGKSYREIVETIIVRGDQILIRIKPDGSYRFPGGSTEPNITLAQQAIKECQEEVHVTPKNLKYYGHYQFFFDKGIEYDGKYVHVFVGEYDKDFNGYVKKVDQDEKMLKESTWRPISEVYSMLQKEHQDALNAWRGVITENHTKSLFEMAYEDAQDFMLVLLQKYCQEFNEKDKYFDQIHKAWLKENPEADEPLKLIPRLHHGNDNQLLFLLADLNTDNATPNQIACYWTLVKDLTDAIKKDPEVKKFGYITRINPEAEDIVGVYVDLLGIGALDANAPEVYWPNVRARVEKSTPFHDHQDTTLIFYNDNHIDIGKAEVRDTGYLHHMEVFPRYRKKNYGNSMMRYLMDRHKITEFCVDTDNEPMLAICQKFGFTPYEKFSDWHANVCAMRLKDAEPILLEESSTIDHTLTKDDKTKLAKKYGITDVGNEHEYDDEKELAEMKRKAAAQKAKKELDKKKKARDKQLKKARNAKKRKAFVNKVKASLPGVKKEEASAVDNPDIDWGDDSNGFFDTHLAGTKKYLKESYQFQLQEKVQFFDRLDEAANKNAKYLPVYVVIMHTGTALSTAIKTVLNSEYSHASISFDSSLTNMYSFARKLSDDGKASHDGGFRTENIQNKFFQDKEIKFSMYMVPCTEEQIKLMKKRLQYFEKNQSKFTYDFTGLIKSYFHISDNPEYRWFCTRFVADILNAGRPTDPYVKDPFLIRPDDFMETNFALYVTSGYLDKYDQKQVDTITKRLLNQKKIQKFVQESENECALDLPRENPYERHVLSYQLAKMDESAVDDFLMYLRSFKVRFDSNGDIRITRREYDQLDAHFRASLKLIKACEDAGNVAGVKEELYKIHYMIELINQYYLKPYAKNYRPNTKDVRKDMLDLRSVMMNAFKQHLEWVTLQEPNYNFQRGYQVSTYGSEIKIPQKVITHVGKTITTLLK
ncbi:MAG: GNAT family N-acetyltransferase [Ruminococcus flavefaciens]|nr:GNAT family N-acetyltransferase [Ruminococcus flavefaciens]